MSDTCTSEARVLVPLSDHRDLPAEPLTRADIPPSSALFVGQLLWYRSRRGRPLMAVRIYCNRCGTLHQHPWRWDWGLSPDVVSYQVAMCWRGTRRPYWVGLAPSKAAENAAVHAEAHEVYLGWAEETKRFYAERKRLKAEQRTLREAAAVESPEPAPPKPAPLPFWMPPVGTSRRG